MSRNLRYLPRSLGECEWFYTHSIHYIYKNLKMNTLSLTGAYVFTHKIDDKKGEKFIFPRIMAKESINLCISFL